ncbi:MAG: family 20 glycosylhydrolase [Saprospiraceae bacterium]
MRFYLFLFLFFFAASIAIGQSVRPVFPDSIFPTYYHQRWTLFQMLPQTPGDILFVGNSITDGGEWQEQFTDLRVKNRGISGDISAGVLHRIDEMTARRPAKVFLMIGTNDLARGIKPDSLLKNIRFIAEAIRTESPATRLYVQSILPVNDYYGKFSGHTAKGQEIRMVNDQLANEASKWGYTYVDLHTPFSNPDGKMDTSLSNDGLHLNGQGYLLWKHLIFPFVYDLQPRPALLPLPLEISWEKGVFLLNTCQGIALNTQLLKQEGLYLQKMLQDMGSPQPVLTDKNGPGHYIHLVLDPGLQSTLGAEGYQLQVEAENINLSAAGNTGIFYGLQTLRQLFRDGIAAPACRVRDYPAYSWRGYMVDVGRNYVPLPALKEQIMEMARYKMNIFHFHVTEDIAWRLASEKYPQLTAPEHTLRNKGMYYTEAEFRELIRFCQGLHITLVPELDMPGHSAAFTRAMQVDMQSPEGLAIVKEILEEFCRKYDLPYFHIGADEVKITNPAFVPEVSALLEKHGKQVIGWQPGGNFTPSTIRHLWLDDAGKITGNSTLKYIDSRHLYLNHFDPLESVPTIFYRQIGSKTKGDSLALGGTICLWPDRAVADHRDMVLMSALYPSLLAFAERSWRGGGQPGWIANISAGDAEAFMEFENRLLDHKTCFFAQKPFPYARQTSLKWDLFGPFPNGGKTETVFEPELSDWKNKNRTPARTLIGGTIILRHWWAFLIKGILDDPQENTTWYATTKIWSDEDTEKDFWIGFNDISRSPATDSPPAGGWDNKNSMVWVNGKIVPPPAWTRAGQKGHPEIPLIDEGYVYRAPTRILLKKGWNEVLIKAPVGSFKAADSQNPVKWMFTFVPL